MFRALASMIQKLERVIKKLNEGGCADSRKVAWIKWENVMSEFNMRLNIGSLKASCLGLLGKWWWRFKVEGNSLWVKVIKSIYRDDGGLRDEVIAWIIFEALGVVLSKWVRNPKGISMGELEDCFSLGSVLEYNGLKEMVDEKVLGPRSQVEETKLCMTVSRKDCRASFDSYASWLQWFSNIRMRSNSKRALEGVFYTMWWSIWAARNQILFEAASPRFETLFIDIVRRSFSWCNARGKTAVSWDSWLKHPHLIIL
ncbi:hypothetical protein Tco_0530981 [Tanacetum coccineum]